MGRSHHDYARIAGSARVPIVSDKLLLRYKFEDDSDTTTALDSATSYGDSTAQNGAINGATYVTDSKDGTFALDFNGASNYVNCDSPVFTDDTTQPLSFSAWVKRRSSKRHIVIARNDGGNDDYQGYSSRIDSGNSYEFIIRTSDGTAANAGKQTDMTLNENQWYHLVATYSGSQTASGITLYVDGSDVSESITTDESLSAQTTTTQPCAIGADNVTNTARSFADAIIDDARIYRKELTSSEVSSIYDNTK